MLIDTDLANAHRLVAAHGKDLRYASTFGWLVFDRLRFVPDDTGRAARRVHRVVRSIVSDAERLEALAALAEEESTARDRDEAKRLRAHARKSQSSRGIAATLSVARTLKPIACTVDDFDRDAWLLNCVSGTIDLRTGREREHRREDLITKVAPVRFDPNARCPQWLKFLERIFAGREALIEFVQRAVGYSLTGDTGEQVLFVLHGDGANGKSTFLESLRSVFGKGYAAQTPTNTLLQVRERGVEHDLARLRGVRFVSAVESGDGQQLDEARVKKMTGGDKLTARFLYGDLFEFDPTFKLWLACNHRPSITGSDHAIWRRVRLIPFDVTIPDAEQDRRLAEKLRAEASGILRWAIDGCLAWQRGGLTAPAEVELATNQYRHDEDVVGRFVREFCASEPGLSVAAGDLYAAYEAWTLQEGEDPVTKKAFSRRLQSLGYGRDRTAHTRLWRGLALGQRGGDR